MTERLTNLNSDLKSFSDDQRKNRLINENMNSGKNYDSKPVIVNSSVDSKDPNNEETAKNTAEMVDKLDKVATILEKQAGQPKVNNFNGRSVDPTRQVIKDQNKAFGSVGG